MKKVDKNHQLKKVLELLKLTLSMEDEELLRSSIESVIETLEELINKTK